MNTKLIKMVFFFIVVLALISTVVDAGQPAMRAQAQSLSSVQASLQSYADSLAGKVQPSLANYSPEMLNLIEDRQDFYQAFFFDALHSELLKGDSSYSEIILDQPSSDQTYQTVHAVETVNLTGISLLKDPINYPMYRAALLASQRATDTRVKQELDAYAARILNEVGESIKSGEYTISWTLNHTITYDLKTGRIVKDSFTDVAKDRMAGTDIVTWNMDTFSRQQPKIESFPDYEMYHSSIEELANGLLEQYNQIFKGLPVNESSLTTYTYSHTGAGNYIRTWVKTTTSTCSDGKTLQDINNYNSSYTPVPCNDCANYVSQALRYGGHPLTTSWSPNATPWVYVPSLLTFIIDNGRGQTVALLSYLGIGDIAFIPNQHVVMVSAINPTRYSAHTYDRLNVSWDSSINTC